MPPVVHVYREWRNIIDTCEAVVIRLHGPDREGMDERIRRRWDEGLREIVRIVEKLLNDIADDVIVGQSHSRETWPKTSQLAG